MKSCKDHDNFSLITNPDRYWDPHRPKDEDKPGQNIHKDVSCHSYCGNCADNDSHGDEHDQKGG